MDLTTLVNQQIKLISDQVDHPELWQLFEDFASNPQQKEHLTNYTGFLKQLLSLPQEPVIEKLLTILFAVCSALTDNMKSALEILESYSIQYSQCPLVAGALFYLQKLQQPHLPKFDLKDKMCSVPFERMDILEDSVHLCCASWLKPTVGNLKIEAWNDVWNSPSAELIRASIFDGSYRYCNKILCPRIQGNQLVPTEKQKNVSPEWKKMIEERKTILEKGPDIINLAYDKTCNLSCPSCRSERFAADSEMRKIYTNMQERNIIPLLKRAKWVSMTGSGDPFASKTFRQLLVTINKTDFPQLKVDFMTNGMLLTRKEWEKFSHLSGQVARVRISIDAATKKTHELLRRGSDWETMLENMKFIGELYEQKCIDDYHITFVVQTENFREMGAAVDIAKEVGAPLIYFSKISNWGTFTDDEFRKITPYNESHPLYEEFVECMQDKRLRDPIVSIPDLTSFFKDTVS